MTTVGIRELKERASEILRDVRETGTIYEITHYGKVIARLVPSAQTTLTSEEADFWLREMNEIGADISLEWQGDSAVEAIREGRRE
jgi:prevent-host-death family protein